MDSIDRFRTLAWNDVEDWAGARIVERGKRYLAGGRVRDLGAAPDGRVVAWVVGTQTYASSVGFGEDGELLAACTCPYWGVCKHAVATLLAFLESLRREEEAVPLADDDRRLALLDGSDEEEDDDWEDEEDEEDDDEEEDDDGGDESGGVDEAPLGRWLRTLRAEELVDLVEDLADSVDGVYRAIEHRRRMQRGDAADLLAVAGDHVGAVAAAAAGYGEWDDADEEDYDALRDVLEKLLDLGRYDEIMALGEDLLDAGKERVEHSHDDLVGYDIAGCMRLVFSAAARSRRPTVERMEWVLDRELADGYGLCDGSSVFWDAEHEAADWSGLADVLLERLARRPPARGRAAYSDRHQRDRLADRAIGALEAAGRSEEVIPLCEREARAGGSYPRLVDRLMAAGRLADAERSIAEGIQATEREWPGVATQLAGKLRTIREAAGDWPAVAAMRAEELFGRPELARYESLLEAADKAGVRDGVRAAVLRALEAGEPPGSGGAPWPLPPPPAGRTATRPVPPVLAAHALLDIALHEQRPGDALAIYRGSTRADPRVHWREDRVDALAEALRQSDPDAAISLWRSLAESLIAQARVKSYPVAGRYLRKIHGLLDRLGRGAEWLDCAASLRKQHGRKRRFLEVLDKVSGQPIARA